MPMIMKCRLCDFEGNHGFTNVNGGLAVYHAENTDGTGKNKCYYYIGDDNKTYKTHLELFRAVTMPRAMKDGRESTKVWCLARIEDITGHPRKAKKLYERWHELADKGK